MYRQTQNKEDRYRDLWGPIGLYTPLILVISGIQLSGPIGLHNVQLYKFLK